MTAPDNYYAVRRMSNTALGYLSKSAAHYRAFLDGQITTDTAPMRIGRIAHTRLLEPDKMPQIALKKNGSSKDGKAHNEMCEAQGIILLNEAEYLLMTQGISRVLQNETLVELLQNAQCETNAYFEYRGIPCKARRDIIGEYRGKRILADTKFVADASDSFLRKADKTYSYDRQMAWYHLSETIAGNEIDEVWLVLIEKTPPYCLRVVKLDRSVIKQGKAKYDTLLDYYEETVAKGLYPGYPDIEWETYCAEELYEAQNMSVNDISALFSNMFPGASLDIAPQAPAPDDVQVLALLSQGQRLISTSDDPRGVYAMLKNATPKDATLAPLYQSAAEKLKEWFKENYMAHEL